MYGLPFLSQVPEMFPETRVKAYVDELKNVWTKMHTVDRKGELNIEVRVFIVFSSNYQRLM
jgi:hypothetical protein